MKIKIKHNWIFLLLILLSACQESQEYYEGIYIVGTEGKELTATLTVDELPSSIGINVAASCTVDETIEVEMSAKPELIETFNKEHKKNYAVLPQKAYELDNTVLKIEQGKHITTEALRLRIISRDELKPGVSYLLPVSIVNVSDKKLSVIEASRTIYIVINQIIVTQAADLVGYGKYYKVNFGTSSKFDTKALKNVTFEARVRFKKMIAGSSKWCFSVMGCEENLCLRTAGNSKEGWKLQLGDPHHVDSRDVLPNDKWIHLACVFNGDLGKKFLYIDGELQGEISDSRTSIDLTNHYAQTAFYIGQSAADNRYMDGWVSEARVWAVARSASDLKNNVCWVDPLSEGLIAYWQFNQPSTDDKKVITDLTGNGYHAKYAGWDDPKFVSGVRCPDMVADE